jgi:wyosine [tRNA(Phe)-imidazoG37] synthetase (radical SAM superfamily)
MLTLRGIDLLLTYECTGRCAHCCYRAGPRRNETMTVAEVEGYLKAVADQPLEWVLLFGGEPFLFPDLLRASVALAAPLAPVLVFTNGCWATDPDIARQRLADLQAAGLDYILFSVDAFHQAHEPLERVVIGIEAARQLGYGTIEIDNRFLGKPEADNVFNRRTRDIMAHLGGLCDLTNVNVIRGPSRMVGRAADQLSSFLPTQTAPATKCPLPDYLGGDLRTPSGVEIHPGGWVNLCAGLALGNAQQRPLDEILAAYDPHAHPLIRVLAQEGPAGLLRLAKRHGVSLAGGYVDGCHLCYQVRRLLRPHYPDHLAPAQPYTEEGAMTVLQLQSDILYGPLNSRRLGRSLGINLLPTDYKLCSFDCVYCHFPTLASAVRRLRDELRPDVKLAILSNSTTVHLPHIREALSLFDAPIMKLDAGDAGTLARINRPSSAVELEHIIEGLKEIPGLIIQSMLLDGKVTNVRGEPLEAWLSALAEIRPTQVQIYSTDRPVPEAGVERVPPSALQRIAGEIERRTGLQVHAYWAQV